MCTIYTNVSKPTNHPFTACLLTTCHKCGRAGHIQCHYPNYNQWADDGNIGLKRTSRLASFASEWISRGTTVL